MGRLEELEQAVRDSGTLVERLDSIDLRVANMCKNHRGPKLSVPLDWNDDDFFIGVTIADAKQVISSSQKKQDYDSEMKRERAEWFNLTA